MAAESTIQDGTQIHNEPHTPRRRVWRSVLIETVPVIVIVAALVRVLAFMSGNAWMDTLLYNADSLVLPLLERSIQSGEPLDWVFSSQLFLFPEGLLYAISSIFSDSTRVVLTINAVLNILAMYALLRWIAHLLARRAHTRLVEIVSAAGVTLIFVLVVLLEQKGPTINSGIATPMLATTFYVGVIIAGLAVVALTLWLTQAFTAVSWGRKRVLVYAAILLVVAGFTTFCDPLFILQVTVPLGLAMLFLVIANRQSWRQLVVLAAANALPIIVGMVLRLVFSSLSPTTLSKYVMIDSIPGSIRLMRNSVVEQFSTGNGTAKFVLLVTLVLVSLGIVVFSVYALARPSLAGRVSTERMFLAGFVSVSVITLLAGTVLSGSLVLRYTAPIAIFPLLTVLSIAVSTLPRLLSPEGGGASKRNVSRVLLAVVAAVAAGVLLVGATGLPKVVAMDSGADYQGEDCFDSWIGNSTANGVGSYWTTRTLQVYGRESGSVLQVDNTLAPFAWMINLDSYVGKKFSYVVIDSTGLVTTDALAPLGTPSKVVECGAAYTIYDYRNTPGEKILTDTVATKLADYRATQE